MFISTPENVIMEYGMPIHILTVTATIRASVGSRRNGRGDSMTPSFMRRTFIAPAGSSAREMSRRLTNCGMAMAMTKQVLQTFLSLTSLLLMATASSIPKK